MALGSLLFRTDANVVIGTGHVMRCLGLAQAWQDSGGHSTFAMADSTPAVEERLRDEDMGVVRLKGPSGNLDDANQTAELANRSSASWVVIDGYHFDAEYQLSLKKDAIQLLFIDDNGHATSYVADIVLNQNAHASADLYPDRQAYTKLLLGTRYAMLRREFNPWRDWKREIPELARRVLVTLGGSDPENATLKVVDALQQLQVDGLQVTVLVGGSNPHLDLIARAAGNSGREIKIVVNASDVSEFMAAADVAICAAGSSCWEMCLLGLPTVLLDLAANQTPVVRKLDDLGAVINVGSASEVSSEQIAGALDSLIRSPEARKQMSERSRELVDGRGAERVRAFMDGDLRLRRSLESDCETIWQWANDPEVRAVSFRSEPIPWDQHDNWFRSKLTDPRAFFYVATNDTGQAIGQVRYQCDEKRAVLSLNMAPDLRGKGFGKKMLLLATEELFQSSNVTVIDAYVKPANHSALRLFESAGFRRNGTHTKEGQPAIHFSLEKSIRS
jgi:UDP-2,4-diacetamido-2,4,6-trideoxy-beta-L-altropyranose hydrolase